MTLSIVRSTCRVWSSVRETSPLIIYLFLVRMKMCRVESTSLNSTSTLSRQNPSQDDVREGRKSSPSTDRETIRFVLLCAKTSFRVDFTLHKVMVQLKCSLFTGTRRIAGTRRINGIAVYVTQEGRQTHKVAWGSLRSILTTARRLLQSSKYCQQFNVLFEQGYQREQKNSIAMCNLGIHIRVCPSTD